MLKCLAYVCFALFVLKRSSCMPLHFMVKAADSNPNQDTHPLVYLCLAIRSGQLSLAVLSVGNGNSMGKVDKNEFCVCHRFCWLTAYCPGNH